MNGMSSRAARRVREQRLSKALFILAIVVLFTGLTFQITLRARIAGQAKQLSAVESEITALSANARNLDLNINQRHNLAEIEARAVSLGMARPDESQLRVVVLPALNGDTSAQTVSIDGEEIQG